MSYEDDEAYERFMQYLEMCSEREREQFIETMPALIAETPLPALMPNEVALYGYEGDVTLVEVSDPSCPPMDILVPMMAGPSSYLAATNECAADPPPVACYRRVGGRVYQRVQ